MIQNEIKSAFELDTAATDLPVTVDDVKTHLRVDDPDENAWIRQQIEVAVRDVENHLKRQLMSATWKLHLDCFPDFIELRKCPVSAVSSVMYYDSDNAQQTLSASDYDVDIFFQPARVTPAYGVTWPSTYKRPGAVTVTFVAGYGSRALVPDTLKNGLKNLVGYRYWNREGGDPEIVAGILRGLESEKWG